MISNSTRGRPRAAATTLNAAHALARDRICEAALAVFHRSGLDAVSMREVSREMGVSPMMIYKYFPSKDHLLQEIRTRAFGQLERVLAEAERTIGPPTSILEAVILAYLEFGRTEPRTYRLMFDYWVYDNPSALLDSTGEHAQRQAGAWNVLLRVVRVCQASSGRPSEALTQAHIIWSAVHGLVSLEVARKLVLGRTYQDLVSPAVRSIVAGVAEV